MSHERQTATSAPSRLEAWVMPKAPELFAFINRNSRLQSLLYDLGLLPEEITDARQWHHLLSVCAHFEMAARDELGRCVKAIEALRDDHCASTRAAMDQGDVCRPEGGDGCDFVDAWNEAIAAIRKLEAEYGR